MQVAKWGNSLAVRLPAAVVQALDLKEGEEVELHVVGERSLEVARKVSPEALLTRLRRLRGRRLLGLSRCLGLRRGSFCCLCASLCTRLRASLRSSLR